MWWGCVGSDCSNSWAVWGRWVLLAVIIVVVLLSFIFLRNNSMRRVSRGEQPIRGTTWMVPPSYAQTKQNSEYPVVPAPPYNPTAGEYDLGHYDNQGVFHQNSAAYGQSNTPNDLQHNSHPNETGPPLPVGNRSV